MEDFNSKECPECGVYFDSYFEAVDHVTDEDDEFDPSLILPNGYRLMVGSLLRALFNYSNEPEKIEKLTEDTYLALFMAEMFPESIHTVIQDSIVAESMENIDDELKQLLKDGEG